MNSKEYTAMHRSYEEAEVMMDHLRFWRLTTPTREMFLRVFDLMEDNDHQSALEVIAQVLAEGEAFAKGYEIPSIFLDRWLPDGRAELIAQPRPIKDDHYLDQETIYCAGKTFRIEDCVVRTREDDPVLYVSGHMLVYKGSLVPENETGEILVAPWNDLGRVEERKFSRYKTFLNKSPGLRSDEQEDTYGL